jgi:hypothetical protein
LIAERRQSSRGQQAALEGDGLMFQRHEPGRRVPEIVERPDERDPHAGGMRKRAQSWFVGVQSTRS